jgi:drug/metabolite transporter (DMT)-like permease
MLYAGVLVLLVLNLAGGILIKLSPQVYHDFLLLGGILVLLLGVYGARSVTWLLLGKRYQLSFIYPILGINYVISLFVGILLFHEPFVWRRLVGAIIILCGVSLLSFSKQRKEVRRERVLA